MENKKLVVFDLDGTLIEENSWYKLNIALGVSPEEDEKMFKAYSSGELKYKDWLLKLVELYKKGGKANKYNIEKALSLENLTFKIGARETIKSLQTKGYKVAIITGSFSLLVEKIREELEADYALANTEIIFDEEENLADVISKGEERYGKVVLLIKLLEELQFSLSDCVVVGDGGNDIELMQAAKKGITFTTASEAIKKNADEVIDSLFDLENLL